MHDSEARMWESALARTIGYEHALVLSALEERIHTWAMSMSEWEEGCEDERLWTWHSEDRGDSLAYQTMSVEEIRALR